MPNVHTGVPIREAAKARVQFDLADYRLEPVWTGPAHVGLFQVRATRAAQSGPEVSEGGERGASAEGPDRAGGVGVLQTLGCSRGGRGYPWSGWSPFAESRVSSAWRVVAERIECLVLAHWNAIGKECTRLSAPMECPAAVTEHHQWSADSHSLTCDTTGLFNHLKPGLLGRVDSCLKRHTDDFATLSHVLFISGDAK